MVGAVAEPEMAVWDDVTTGESVKAAIASDRSRLKGKWRQCQRRRVFRNFPLVSSGMTAVRYGQIWLPRVVAALVPSSERSYEAPFDYLHFRANFHLLPSSLKAVATAAVAA